MARQPSNLILLGSGAVTGALKIILAAPVCERRQDDLGWSWPAGGLGERCKAILIASPQWGADRIIRYHDELWHAPKASHLGVVIVVPEGLVAQELVQRDVFGRKGNTGSTFSDYSDVIRIPGYPITLANILRAWAEVEPLLVHAWHRAAKDASCLPPLVKALQERSSAALIAAASRARNVHWDSICFPTPEYSDSHQYANAIRSWLDSVTLGVTPSWEVGMQLIQPLANR